MRECEALFGEVAGKRLHELVEESIGGECPCLRGDPCPFVPGEAVAHPLVLPTPHLRATA